MRLGKGDTEQGLDQMLAANRGQMTARQATR